ncbi:MAG: hypothetical protein LBL67_06170 [Coriobacteriales bacterium]|jgi:hypothetical protein|nr:hypothetical protein [Coriobacteriales bacterium]
MYLKKTKASNGRTFLSAVYSFRDGNGKIHSKTYRSFGYLEDYQDEYPDPLAHFQELVSELNESPDVQAELKGRKQFSPRTLSGEQRKVVHKNLGYIVPLHYYHSLGLHTFMNNMQQRQRTLPRMNLILRGLVMLRCLQPLNLEQEGYDLERLFDPFDYGAKELAQFSALLKLHRESIYQHLQSAAAKLYRPQRELGYFFFKHLYFGLRPDGSFDTKQVDQDQADITIRSGLVCDAQGYPLEIERLSRQPQKATNVIAGLQDLRQRNHLERLVSVGALHQQKLTRISTNDLKEQGFLISLDIASQDRELYRWALESPWIDEMDNCRLKSKKFKCKLPTLEADGKVRQREHKLKVVCIWSPIRAEIIRKMQQIGFYQIDNLLSGEIGAEQPYSGLFHAGAATPKIEQAESSLRERELLAGYNLLVTDQTQLENFEIMRSFQQWFWLGQMLAAVKPYPIKPEGEFKQDDYIEAHMMICFMSAILLFLIKRGAGNTIRADRISRELDRLECFNVERNIYFISYWSERIEKILDSVGVNFPNNSLTTAEIKHWLGKVK